MHLLAREEVGLRCLLQVALRCDGGPVPIGSVAAAEDVSFEYAAKLLRRLRLAGLLHSSRGAQGGYRLARRAEDISVFEALQALDDAFLPTDRCACAPDERSDCSRTTRCAVQSLWRRIGEDLKHTLGATSLDDLCRESRALERAASVPLPVATQGHTRLLSEH